MTTMPGTTGRRELVRVGAVGAVVGLGGMLVGCVPSQVTAGDDAEELAATLGTEPERVYETLGLGLERPGEGAGVLATPDGAYAVDGVGLIDRFTADQLEDRLYRFMATDEDVVAPEGEVYLVVSLVREGRGWQTASTDGTDWLTGAGPVTTARLIVVRDGEEVAATADLWLSESAWLLRVPADPAPDEAVLEVETDGKIQRLSLVDGSLISSDVPQVYGRSAVEDYAQGEDDSSSLYLDAEDERGNRDSLSVYLNGAWATPLSTALGWADDGRQHLAVLVDTQQSLMRDLDKALLFYPVRIGAATATADGEASVEPALVEHVMHSGSLGLSSRDTWVVWFSVPADFTTVEAVIGLDVLPRREGLAEALGLGEGLRFTVTGTPVSGDDA
ncbi:hypothetical protein ACXET9_08320 [Brachybacterium sp. DNPG3]